MVQPYACHNKLDECKKLRHVEVHTLGLQRFPELLDDSPGSWQIPARLFIRPRDPQGSLQHRAAALCVQTHWETYFTFNILRLGR